MKSITALAFTATLLLLACSDESTGQPGLSDAPGTATTDTSLDAFDVSLPEDSGSEGDAIRGKDDTALSPDEDAETPGEDAETPEDGCTGICGDLNQDGDLDESDLEILTSLVSGGLDVVPSDCAFSAGDLHKDGALTEADLALLPLQTANALTAACQPCDMICGDITGDAIADALDVEELTTIILGGPPYDACMHWGADTTKDGELNVSDVNAIIDYINNGTPLTCLP